MFFPPQSLLQWGNFEKSYLECNHVSTSAQKSYLAQFQRKSCLIGDILASRWIKCFGALFNKAALLPEDKIRAVNGHLRHKSWTTPLKDTICLHSSLICLQRLSLERRQEAVCGAYLWLEGHAWLPFITPHSGPVPRLPLRSWARQLSRFIFITA